MATLKGVGVAVVAAAALAIPATISTSATASASVYNEDTVAQFIAAIDREEARYGTGHVPVYVQEMNGADDYNAIAATYSNGSIVINARYAAMTPEQFNAAVEEDVAAGYQPGGCSGIWDVAIHEMGHVIDNRHGRVARYTLAQAAAAGRVSSNMHGYAFNKDGSVNPGEAIAVSFQAVECGSATMTEQRIYNLLVS